MSALEKVGIVIIAVIVSAVVVNLGWLSLPITMDSTLDSLSFNWNAQ